MSKDHFYDGLFYHFFIDPLLWRVRRLVAERVEPGSSLLDVGCGTGRLLLALRDRCRRLAGVERSARMVRFARRRTKHLPHIRILEADAARLPEFPAGSFDYAVASMVFHETEESNRLPVLAEMARVARRLIVVDYEVPIKFTPSALLVGTIERLAGKGHHLNFLSFRKSGGIPALFARSGLRIDETLSFSVRTLRLAAARTGAPAVPGPR